MSVASVESRLGAGLQLQVPLVLGVVHLVVDASSNFVVVRLLRTASPSALIAVLVAYNFAAFALQPLVGLVTDRWRAPRAVMAVGLLLAAAALVLSEPAALAPLILTGLGNALFHVGAGALASNATPGKASGPGLFIGPGAIGVVVGALAGRSIPAAFWPMTLFLLACAPLSFYVPTAVTAAPLRTPTAAPRALAQPLAHPHPHAGAILSLLLLAIAGRALLGARVGSQFAQHAELVLPLAVAACVGKATGGLAADRAGWKRSAIVLLLVSSLLLPLGGKSDWAAWCGVACFQAVTGITLAAVYRVLPERIALGFGLASLSLFVGCLPVLLHVDGGLLERAPINSLLALGSALAVWRALAWLEVGPAGEIRNGVPATHLQKQQHCAE